jgi:hypothetical protein
LMIINLIIFDTIFLKKPEQLRGAVKNE